MAESSCSECGQQHGGLSAAECTTVVRAYAESSALAIGQSRDFAWAFGAELLRLFPPPGSAFLGMFLEACRYFASRPPPGPEIADIVHRQRSPFVSDLRAAGAVAEHGELVIYEGRERVWNGEAWEERNEGGVTRPLRFSDRRLLFW